MNKIKRWFNAIFLFGVLSAFVSLCLNVDYYKTLALNDYMNRSLYFAKVFFIITLICLGLLIGLYIYSIGEKHNDNKNKNVKIC